jgi:hypothetical protein
MARTEGNCFTTRVTREKRYNPFQFIKDWKGLDKLVQSLF